MRGKRGEEERGKGKRVGAAASSENVSAAVFLADKVRMRGERGREGSVRFSIGDEVSRK